MSSTAPVAAKANGLSTVANTIVSPSEAFATLRIVPTWGWACLIAIILMVIGTYLEGPASRHAAVAQMQHSMATNSFFANMTAAQKAQAIARAGQPSPIGYVFVVVSLFFAVFFNTIILLAGNAMGNGKADFKRLWAGSMNIAVPTMALGTVALGIITMLRGADSFNSTAELARAMPSLAMLIPGATTVVAAFFSGFSLFTLWGFFLNAQMMKTTAGVSSGIAYGFALLPLLLGALLAAAFAMLAHNFGMA